jgi:hypothetical protein
MVLPVRRAADGYGAAAAPDPAHVVVAPRLRTGRAADAGSGLRRTHAAVVVPAACLRSAPAFAVPAAGLHTVRAAGVRAGPAAARVLSDGAGTRVRRPDPAADAVAVSVLTEPVVARQRILRGGVHGFR